MAADTIQYEPGMSYADFLAMMAQRRSGATESEPCSHPYERLITNIRGKRAHTPGAVLVIVEFTCGDCDTYLGMQKKGFRV